MEVGKVNIHVEDIELQIPTVTPDAA
jgi:hypothetical protein